jgi:spermidine synthase
VGNGAADHPGLVTFDRCTTGNIASSTSFSDTLTLTWSLGRESGFVNRRTPARRIERRDNAGGIGMVGRRDLTLVLLGFATALAQAVLLREAMAGLGGSELAWGAVMGVWLAGMGVAAWVCGRRRPRGGGRWSPALVVAGAAIGALAFRALPVAAGLSPGETATSWRVAWLWALGVAIPAVAGGAGFAAASHGLTGPGSAARAYCLEGLGAVAGGLVFTLVLAGIGSGAVLIAAAGGAVAFALGNSDRWWLAGLAALSGVAAAGPAEQLLSVASWRWSGRLGELAAVRETRQQRLELSSGAPVALYADGRLVAVVPDRYRVALRTHLAMLLAPRPGRVLLIGGTADGTVPAILKHPVQSVTVVAEDPALVALLPGWFGDAAREWLGDSRVHWWREPLLGGAADGSLDLILLFDQDPVTLRANRTRTVEFLQRCQRWLDPGGALVMRVGVGDTYLGGAGGRLAATLAATLGRVFAHVAVVPGEEILLVAGGERWAVSTEPEVLAARWRERHIAEPDFDPDVLPVLLDPARASSAAASLRATVAAPNTASKPRAVLLASALQEARGHPGLLRAALALERFPGWIGVAVLAAVVAAVLFPIGRSRRWPVPALVVGFASIGWWLILLGSWQSTRGSVYAEVGALSAAFMAGVVIGSGSTRNRELSRGAFAAALGAGVLLSLVLASGAAMANPWLVAPLLVVAGLLTGRCFGPAAVLAAGDARSGAAARGFGADELGAGTGALVVGLVVVPWVGMVAAALTLAAIMAAAGVAVWLRH